LVGVDTSKPQTKDPILLANPLGTISTPNSCPAAASDLGPQKGAIMGNPGFANSIPSFSGPSSTANKKAPDHVGGFVLEAILCGHPKDLRGSTLVKVY